MEKKIEIIESYINENTTKYILSNGHNIVVEDNSGTYIRDFTAHLLNKDGTTVAEASMYEVISPISGDRTEERYDSSIPEEYAQVLQVINEDLYPCLLSTKDNWMEEANERYDFDEEQEIERWLLEEDDDPDGNRIVVNGAIKHYDNNAELAEAFIDSDEDAKYAEWCLSNNQLKGEC